MVHKEPLWKGLPWMKDAAGLCLGLVCVTFGLGEPEGLAGSMEAQKHHVLFCSLLLATVCRLEGSFMDFGVFFLLLQRATTSSGILASDVTDLVSSEQALAK